ncbi:MAG: 2-amino-4-hydroxy-6-hydroxymethyldihydropteridine diphosphokinase [Bacteroidetes bacterium]|nr:2-amino-4-hydroxy-6-hydroxymethyldihydropteridine diphosphokinase [Bacteroidota bacterium]HET6243515.1 2-amino-4-hydroxy-6-hydroxymethyldihydropteridine diphosphokinase [Bacteroidia bacterium]
MEKAVLLLGSNLGDSLEILHKALSLIVERIGKVEKISEIYQSKPWGFEHKNDFLNQVIVVNTTKSPANLLSSILEIEHEMGRIRIGHVYMARIIDIDILYYNEKVLNLENLKIPHPLLHKRKFTLIPLVEILPEFIHPIFQKTNLELLEGCTDNSEILKR